MALLIRLGALISACAATAVLTASRTFADHETRATEIQENGLDPWLMGLTIGAIVVALVVFGAAVLIWERRDDPDRPASPDAH